MKEEITFLTDALWAQAGERKENRGQETMPESGLSGAS